MTASKPKSQRAKTGRPTKYRAEFPAQAAKLCRLGATDRDLADFFGVSESTLNLWKLKHRPFSESLTRSKEEMDAQVERSLFQRAMGYSHHAVKLFQHNGSVVQADFTEHFPPDTTACIFWLKNRKKAEWRDRQDDLPGGDDEPTPVRVVVDVKDARRG